MKKNAFALIILVLIAIGGFLSLLFLLQRDNDSAAQNIGTFDLTKYQWEVQSFSTNNNIGEVKDKSAAINEAKSLWLEKYNIDAHERNVEVFYDSKEECWHVCGALSPDKLGGDLHAIIRKNGDVLAVWIDD